MKKFLLYFIVFISLFLGSATCVIVNGYSNYQKQLSENPQIGSGAENTILTSLASNVLNSECYSGNIEFNDNKNSTAISGNFSYINNNGISAQINLTGSVNNFKFNSSIILLKNQLYLEFNGSKFTLNTNDILTALNAVISSVNSGSGSELSEIDPSALTSLLGDIKTTEYGSEHIITANIPNICNIYIKTNSEYIPNQILVTNLSFGTSTYTLNITATQKKVEITDVNHEDFINISPAIDYIAPILNTCTQGNLSMSGTLDIAGTILNIRTYYNNTTKLLSGHLTLGELILYYQFDGKYVYIDLYSNKFKFTIDEIGELLNILGLSTNKQLDVNEIIKQIEITPTIKSDKLTACAISYQNTTFDFTIGKTLYIPKTFSTEDCGTIKDLKNLITSYKNAISNNYSLDIALKYNSIEVSGKVYVNIENSFGSINQICFDGKINNYHTLIIYNPTTTYIKLGNNKIKLQNTALKDVVNSVFELINQNGTAISSSLDINLTLLNNITISGKKITFSKDNINISITSYQKSYELNANIDGVMAAATIYPNSTSYQYIKNKINPDEYKSFDNAPNLINALKNTLKDNLIQYYGNISIKILDFEYQNIGVDLKIDQSIGKITITLSNLPTDGILTNLRSSCYKNHTSQITIYNGNVSIYTTVTHRVTNKTACLANKTIPINSFGLDNLYDIFAMRKTIINTIKSSESSDFSSNLTTDAIEIYKNSTVVNLLNIAPKFFSDMSIEFCYDQKINQATFICNLKSVLSVKFNLYKY